MRSLLRLVFVVVLVGHGLIHLLGTVKGFGWADVPALRQPVTRGTAWLWLAAAALVLAAGVLLALRSELWWATSAAAAVVSQAAILTSWRDAKAGTVVNLVLLAAAVAAALARHPAADA